MIDDLFKCNKPGVPQYVLTVYLTVYLYEYFNFKKVCHRIALSGVKLSATFVELFKLVSNLKLSFERFESL